MKLSERIASWIKKQVEAAGKKGVVLGLSGGIDSACVAALSKMAMGNNALALILPCESNPEDIKHARDIAKKFNIKTKEVYLDDIFNKVAELIPDAKKLARANLKPRLRMVTLYYFANALDYVVAGTGNKSEITVGYFTKYGDGGVDMLPLGDLLKTEVRTLARELGIAEEIITKVPSAGLWQGQTDEGEMGITYDELDRVIAAILADKTGTIDKDVLSRVKKMIKNSEHKKCEIPIFKNKT